MKVTFFLIAVFRHRSVVQTGNATRVSLYIPLTIYAGCCLGLHNIEECNYNISVAGLYLVLA
jgi:hypothetical protein